MSFSLCNFLKKEFRHFNAATLVDAADAYVKHIQSNGKMLLAMAGAMSTAELGISLADMIRQDMVHAVSCTGANLEEDLYNLVGHDHYLRIPHYRELTPQQEAELRDKKLSRVTDTCIPEEEAMIVVEKPLLKLWQEADKSGLSRFPYEFIYDLLRSGDLTPYYQIDPRDSWVVAACERNIPIFTPGWEDSTLGNFFTACVIQGKLTSYRPIRSGLEQMEALTFWYRDTAEKHKIGFFQIGGGIAGDFAICVVPLLRQELKLPSPYWSYFCQISDSTTSYGSYSGAVPSEKISWGKIDVDTPRFVIESDATIVAPLLFRYVLESCARTQQAFSDNRRKAKRREHNGRTITAGAR